jgi:hypothetical protein
MTGAVDAAGALDVGCTGIGAGDVVATVAGELHAASANEAARNKDDSNFMEVSPEGAEWKLAGGCWVLGVGYWVVACSSYGRLVTGG